jgi:hypothetical protein
LKSLGGLFVNRLCMRRNAAMQKDLFKPIGSIAICGEQ